MVEKNNIFIGSKEISVRDEIKKEANECAIFQCFLRLGKGAEESSQGKVIRFFIIYAVGTGNLCLRHICNRY